MAEQFEDLLRQVDIVKVISNYIEISKKGSNYEAICPFHNDTRPSLKISPTKQIFNCFVCHTGGNAFTFVQKFEKIPYIQAVKKACDICGVKTDISIRENKEVALNKEVFAALEDASKYYQIYLKTNNGKEGLNYLLNRGLSEDIIKKFRLGFAPRDSKLIIEYLRKNNHSIENLIKAGILSDSASFTDRFYNRVMFPITDEVGRVRGFSGRTLEKTADNKYVNYPETILFKKNELLYNLYNAIPLAKKHGFIYIVEGFMDAIALEQVNYPVVATMGTALTENHIARLKRLNVEIRLLLDSDNAGQQATIVSSKNLAKHKVNFKLVKPFKDVKDPDEMLQKNGMDGLIKSLNEVEEPILAFLNRFNENGLLKTYDQKENFLKQFYPLLINQTKLIKDKMIEELANVLGFSVESINAFFVENNAEVKSTTNISSSEEDEYLNLKDLLMKNLKGENRQYKGSNYESIVLYECKILNALKSSRTYYNIFHTTNTSFISSSLNQVSTYLGVVYTQSDCDKIDNERLNEILNNVLATNDVGLRFITLIIKVLLRTDDENLMSEKDFRYYLQTYNKTKRINLAKLKEKELR